METDTLQKFPRRQGATDDAALENIFIHHSPVKKSQVKYYEAVRGKALDLAKFIADHTPPSREQSLALTNLEQASMFAIAACARNASEYPADES